MILEADGTVAVHVGSSAIGQGLETALSQIAADALELPIERIRLLHGSTTGVSDGWGSYHSRSIVMGGSAILLAATALRDKIRGAAASRFGCSPDVIELAEGRARGPDGGALALADLAVADLVAEATFRNSKHTYSYGTHVAHVAVDPRTGHIALIDYVAVEDAGRIINPLTLHGQTIGAIVQGLGGTLLEELIYDDAGQMRAGSFADYLLPLASDFPHIRAVSLQLRPSPINPLGAKGAGEGGIIPVGGVIANAVAAALGALGVEPRALPLSPSRVWQLVQDAAPPR
jgi:carbon-monoxide dehydrogenase large subunit